MPRDSNGNASTNPVYIAVPGEDIRAVQHNTPISDIIQMLTGSLARNGTGGMLANLQMNSHKITGLSNGVSATDAATVQQAVPRVGDFLDSARELDSTWLRRNGIVYSAAVYPELAALMPGVDSSMVFEEQTTGTTNHLNGIAFNGSKYICVGNSGTIISSEDGVNWSSVTSGTTSDILSVTYSNSLWVATLLNGNVISSGTGNSSDWTLRTTGQSTQAFSCVYAEGVWVVVGGTPVTAGSGWIITSTDLVTWTTRTPGTINARTRVCYGLGYFAASGAGGYVTKSADGLSWSNVTIGSGTQADTWASFAKDYFFVNVQGGNMYKSTDTSTWYLAPFNIGGVIYSSSYGSEYVIVGSDAIYVVNDDISSAIRQNLETSYYATGVIFDVPSSKYIICCRNGAIVLGEIGSGTLFLVPDDNPTYGWIKALPE